jgi:hypothetical protein
VRIGFKAFIRRRNTHHAERIARPLARFLGRDLLMRLNGFDHLRINAQHRVQRHHRVLEDHGDAVAPQIAHFFFG